MRILTCRPKNFRGGEIFFSRDSGLCSRGLASIGIDSRSVSLAPAREGDLDELIRATREEMADPSWWRKQNADAVVLFSLADPQFLDIAKAIVASGAKLLQIADHHAIYSPLTDWPAHCAAAWHHHWYEPGWKKLLRTAAKLPISHTLGLLTVDLPVARMVVAGDIFGAATPAAVERFRRLVRITHGKQAAQKVRLIPFPVGSHFIYDGTVPKEDLVVSVGRWHHPQKRAPLLIATIERILNARPTTRFMIFGTITPSMLEWHGSLPNKQSDRVKFCGKVPNVELARSYQKAQIMLISSAYEGCHIASAEAMCCGCSIAGCDSPFLGALRWHAEIGSGSLAHKATARSLSEATCRELDAWTKGTRDPSRISQTAVSCFHTEQVARTILASIRTSDPAGGNPKNYTEVN